MSSSSPSSKRVVHGVEGASGSSNTIARGPAIQRLIVVGPTMGGKRTFVDRLRSSSEATNLSKGQLDGSPPRRLHGRQPREQPQPYKTLHGPHHGCSMHFTSIAYHYNLEASKRAMLGGASSSPSPVGASSSSAADETASVLLNNTVMEVLVCDTPETLLQAMPTDPDQLLHSTAVVIALSATEVYSISADLGAWTTAINEAVTSVVTKHNNRVAAAKKHAQQQGGGGAASRRGGGSVAPVTDSSAANALTTFDIRKLTEARALESEVEQEAFGGGIKGAFLQASRTSKDWSEPSMNKEGGAAAASTAAPTFPDSGKCLLPTLVLLSKMDVLEEVCKKPQHASGSGSPLNAFQAAVQHSRWQALQRGAAFAAISNKGFSNAMSAVFDALWRYIAFALFPQRRVQEHLKLIRRQDRKKHASTAGRRGGRGGSEGESDDEANRQEEEEDARREIDDAVAAARQQRAEEDGLDATAGGLEDSVLGRSPAATTTNAATASGINNQEQSVNHLKSVLSSSTIKTSLNAVASQTIFIPKGLDDPCWLYRESFAARWLHMYNVFKLICSTEAASAVSDDSIVAPSSSVVNKHAGKARLESFSKEMAEALGATGGASQMPAGSPTAFAPSATSVSTAVPASSSSPTATAPPAETGGRTEGGAATTTAEDEELVWDSI